jgi:hypothetical protein
MLVFRPQDGREFVCVTAIFRDVLSEDLDTFIQEFILKYIVRGLHSLSLISSRHGSEIKLFCLVKYNMQ